MQIKGAPIHVSAVLPAQVATRIFEDAPTDRKSSFVERQREMMHAMVLQMGLTPMQAGEVILEGIASGAFWVFTHPETTAEIAQGRADYFAGEKERYQTALENLLRSPAYARQIAMNGKRQA
ncbi:hypothetical protein [Sphingobium sp.]|uniref:hypothetical protein n=1 Tax=Sphingobium sp. TaxID=1912891 RepID=UPI002C612B64|nr:hypothetical protein [Sphingobium sp.]HUD93333.1 hypothetical protein [Sphingobium sp.]